MPFIAEKFDTYDAFARASLTDIFEDELAEAYQTNATEFRSFLLPNEGARTEVETPRGCRKGSSVLYSNGKSGYIHGPRIESGLFINGDTKSLVLVEMNELNKEFLLAGRNNNLLAVFEVLSK